MSQFPLQLRQYFFTHVECRANPEHDPSGNIQGTQIAPVFSVTPIDGSPDAVAIELSVSTKKESENPPYFFAISAFGILDIIPGTSTELINQLSHVTGAQILLGAIREELARITARGPWGTFILPIFVLPTSVAPTMPITEKIP